MAQEKISAFFENLGFPLKNDRWSWGASNGDGILLRTWLDDYESAKRRVKVLGWEPRVGTRESSGLNERIQHLRTLWEGGVPAYTVIATAVDAETEWARKIKEFRPDAIFPIERLELDEGAVFAVLGKPVPVGTLAAHSKTNRVQGHSEPLPPTLQTRRAGSTPADGGSESEPSYRTKLPAIRDWLIAVAQRQARVTYGDVMTAFKIDRFSLRHAMDFLGHEAQDRKEPIITALIVNKQTQRCSIGIAKEFGVADDEAERQRLYEFWKRVAIAPPAAPAATLEERAARFASVEVRPDQAAFRRAVFIACGGKCVVSGCAVDRALDAAHLDGRDWRLGHNNAEDGVLLRKDLHALYDAKLLRIASGVVELMPAVMDHYEQYAGAKLPV